MSMKELDLNLVNQGHKIQTRDGRPARIICTNAKNSDFPVVVLITCENGEEVAETCTKDGHININMKSERDIFMVSTVHKYWINLYRNSNGCLYAGDLFDSKEKALKIGQRDNKWVAVKKIKLEE